MTDEQLIAAFRGGDDSAFEKLIKRHESRVAATVIGMLGNCPEAEDVGQEVFIRFYRGIDKFRGESSVGTYLTRIAINLSLNELKKRKRRSMLFSQKSNGNPSDIPAEGADNPYDADKEIIRRVVQTLHPDFRSVIVLRLMDGYSTKETAEILGIPEGTVLSRLARAQMKLKKILSPYFGGSDG
ncbi:MAG: sigma-70 family RNA polymerase sigma factor [bacterium]